MGNIIPNISVDCAIFGFDGEHLNILLVERELIENGERIFKDYTLTGYHIQQNQDLNQAATQILHERTGLKNIYLEQVHTFGETDRLLNPRDQRWIQHLNKSIDNHTITIAYFALIDNTKVSLAQDSKASWFPIHQIPQLGYDHRRIIEKSLEALRVKAQMEPIIFELLPEKFTLTQLQKAYEVVLDTELDRRNFRKKVAQMKFIIPLNEKQTGVAHKPAQLFLFSKEVYEKTKRERYVISI